MKIRQGFVSNSSSASYIVTIKEDIFYEDSLLNDIYEKCWPGMMRIEANKIEREERWERENPVIPNTITTIPFVRTTPKERRQVSIGSDYIDDREQRIQATKNFLRDEGIDFEKINGKWVLKYWTVMHNSFDDMSDTLKMIYFEYLNQGGVDFTFESDN